MHRSEVISADLFTPGTLYLVVADPASVEAAGVRLPLGCHCRVDPAGEDPLGSVDVRQGDLLLCLGRRGRSDLILDPVRDEWIFTSHRGLFRLRQVADDYRNVGKVNRGNVDFYLNHSWCRIRPVERAR